MRGLSNIIRTPFLRSPFRAIRRRSNVADNVEPSSKLQVGALHGFENMVDIDMDHSGGFGSVGGVGVL